MSIVISCGVLTFSIVFNFIQNEGETGEPYFRRLVLRSVAHIIRLYSSSLITECEVCLIFILLFYFNRHEKIIEKVNT